MSRLKNNVCLQMYLKLQDHIEFLFQSIVAQCNNHIVIQHISGLTLRGQFELLGENILFGSPWFTSMVELMNKGYI
jgi:hypothetical protein